jgi:translation initiation factor IF-2
MRTRRTDDKLRDRVRAPIPAAAEMAAEPGRFALRAPIVTVMGHVDHGKTTLMDALRGGTGVAEVEAGGITQGVAAFSVSLLMEARAIGADRAWRGEGKAQRVRPSGGVVSTDDAIEDVSDIKAAEASPDGVSKKRSAPVPSPDSSAAGTKAEAGPSPAAVSPLDVMTFIDTPGHALFSSMRKRGSSVTDVVVLVVDGKDGVMPQTRECVKLILDAGTPSVVALTKCDLLVDAAQAAERIGKQLLELGLATESFGGDVPIVPVSARTGRGLRELKDALALQAEMLDLRADAGAMGECVVLDSRVVQGMGQVCDTIVRWGTPRVGDVVVAGDEFGRIKSLLTDAVAARSLGRRLEKAPKVQPQAIGGGKKSSGAGSAKDGGSGEAQSFALAPVSEVLPGTPVRVLGLRGCPAAGSDLLVVESEDRARAILAGRLRRAQAQALLRIAAADAVRRESERDEYKLRRQRKAAFELATQRERRRFKLRKAGQPVPEDLALQPWEVAIMQEGRDGKVEGVNSRGKRQRQQGGQQGDVGMGFRLSDLVARGEMTPAAAAAASAAEGGSSGAADDGEVRPPAPVAVAFVLKADSAGALVAVEDAIARIAAQTTAVLPRIVSASVGEVREKDVEYADAMKAHVLAFNARVPAAVQKAAERRKLKIRGARVIYHLLDEVCELLGEHLPAEVVEEVVAAAEVKAVFALNANRKSDPERVAGCTVVEGTLARGAPKYRLLRGGKAVHEGAALGSLQIFKEKVDSVPKGKDCGVSVAGWHDYEVGDRIEAVRSREKKVKLVVKFD